MDAELRTSSRGHPSLARLRHRQRRIDDAREILSQVYRRFTEGFDRADVRAANTLLSVLARDEK